MYETLESTRRTTLVIKEILKKLEPRNNRFQFELKANIKAPYLKKVP